MKRLFLTGLYCIFYSWMALMAQEVGELNLFQPLTGELRNQKASVVQLEIDISELRSAYQQGLADHLEFQLPLNDGPVSFPLQRVDLFDPEFQLKNARGEVIPVETGRHYQAFQGDTLITLSVFPTGLHAQLSTPEQNFTLASDPRAPTHYYWNSAVRSEAPPSSICQTSDEIDDELRRSMQKLDQSVLLRSSFPALSVYFEMDHFIYLEQEAQIDRCLLLMAGVFNSVAQIYRLEGIGLRLKELKIWDTPDAFSREDAREALFSFRSYLSETYTNAERDWDMAVLLSRYTNAEGRAPNGGLANINSLCNLRLRQGYANISSWYNDYPFYSWTVFVIAHEIGHTIASPHSHNCFWPEGPLDDCYCPEGSCDPGPSVADQGGGTIMSYCYLEEPFSNFCLDFPSGGNPGVNYLRAFGKYPGDLMRQRIQEKSCLEDRPLESLPNLEVAGLSQLSRINDTVFVKDLLVLNSGVDTAVASRVGVYQGSNLLAWVPVEKMSGGDSVRLDFQVLIPNKNPWVDFSFQADIAQEVTEWHEGDNFYEHSLDSQQNYPNLFMEIDSSWVDAEYFFVFQNINLQNRGWANSSPLELRCYLEQSGELMHMLSQKRLSPLVPEGNYRFSIAAYEPGLALPSGDYDLTIEILAGGEREVYRWPTPIHIRGVLWEWFRK